MAGIRIAQTLGIGSAAWIAGNIAGLSLVAVPALQQSQVEDGVGSTILVRQWRHLYNNGKSQMPPVAATGAAAFSYLAWMSRHLVRRNLLFLYAGSAVLTIGIVPFTIIAMTATNNKLLAHAVWSQESSKSTLTTSAKLEDSEIDRLLVKWGRLNLVRSLLPLVACTLGIVAL